MLEVKGVGRVNGPFSIAFAVVCASLCGPALAIVLGRLFMTAGRQNRLSGNTERREEDLVGDAMCTEPCVADARLSLEGVTSLRRLPPGAHGIRFIISNPHGISLKRLLFVPLS